MSEKVSKLCSHCIMKSVESMKSVEGEHERKIKGRLQKSEQSMPGIR